MKKLIVAISHLICPVLLLLSLNSCNTDVGLGEEVDVVAPVISVKSMACENSSTSSFAGGVYCHRHVSFAGTATDNSKVTSVYTQIKWAGESSYSNYKTASLSGDSWSLDFEFEKEGTAFLKFIASDAAGNFGSKSSRTVVLFVDENAPVGNAWYIDRKINGIQYSLHDLETLKALDPNATENKDAFQNVAFSISANFNDAMGIDESNPPKISIYTENETKVCEIEKTTSSSIYAPVFEVTHNILKTGLSTLDSGCHYLQVRYTAQDVVKEPSANSVTDEIVDAGWFVWWPESDIPRYEISETVTEDSINVYVNSVFSVTIFDDDELDIAKCKFTFTGDGSPVTKQPSISSGEREKVITINAPSTPQTATLEITGKGKAGTTDGGKTCTKTITVNVIDESSPMLLITSPKNNAVPAVTMTGSTNAKVTISGEALDASGCKYLEFVWVPNSIAATTSEKSTIARTWLATLDEDSKHDTYKPTGSSAKKTEITDVGTVWSVPLVSAPATAGFVTQDFSFDVDLFTDFGAENKTTTEKFFVAKLTRSGNTAVYQEYKFAGDTSLPTISPVTPSGDMAIVSAGEPLTLEFKGVKTSGMGMDTSKYEIRRVDASANDGKFGTYDSSKGYATVSGHYDSSSKTYKADSAISTDTLNDWKSTGVKPKFQFFAEDLLGNKGVDQYTIVISNLPILKSITSPSSTLCKKGDEIIINAVFDNTVTLSNTSGVYVKLTGITNSSSSVVTDKAYYKSGSGSTSLVFSYKVNEGDSSSKLCIDNDHGSPIEGIASTIATLVQSDGTTSVVNSENLLQNKKTIVIDGVSPKASVKSIKSDIATAELANYKKGDVLHLKEARTLTVEVQLDESVFIQGSPSFKFNVGSDELELPFTSSSGTIITFSKKIYSTDANGELKYIPSACIDGFEDIIDNAGNSVALPAGTSATAANIVVDTKKPNAPDLNIRDSEGRTVDGSGQYANYVHFFVTSGTDSTVKLAQYSVDGGSNWLPSSTTGITEGESGKVKLESSAQLTARRIDYAGNISDYSDILNLDINSTFPDYDVECTKPDGNFKAGSKLIFKLSFASKVNIALNSQAYIKVTGSGDSDTYAQGANEGKAYLSDNKGNAVTARQSEITVAYFTYVVQDPDEFSLKVASGDVVLTGFTDMYGIAQGNKDSTRADYLRDGIKCDGVPPRVKEMTPTGEKGSSNIFTGGNVITLKFKEKVQKGSGNLTLRQVAGWAIPPVLTATDFNTICNAISSTDKEVLSMQENGSDMQDVQDLLRSNGNAQDKYHGDAQYVGPYKKSTQGLKLSGSKYVPDISTKYVLDFDIDIWETTETHPIGKSFDASYAESKGFQTKSRTGLVKVVTPTTTRSAQQIRDVLEKAHYHERVIDVTSAYVQIDTAGTTVTVTFPQGLCDESAALPDGREWELVIDKGSFMDMTGNEFGVESDGEMVTTQDAIQTCGTTPTQTPKDSTFATWKRGRTDITDGSNAKVLIKTTAGNESFFSDKVAKPVVRVDRYSYRLGVIQSDASGTATTPALLDSVKPTGYVRVRIDCETKDASIAYSKNGNENSCTATAGSYSGHYINNDNAQADSYYTSTDDLTSITDTLGNTYSGVFAGGYGHYNKSYKQFIIAQGTKTGFTASERGFEGIYQTVVQQVNPTANNGSCATKADGYTDVSLRGTTGFAGEPSISPFPLRDNHNASPYLCRCYRERADINTSTDYYWVSYEILVDSSFSNYSGTGWDYNWAQNWGFMRPGEFTYCTGMKNWN